MCDNYILIYSFRSYLRKSLKEVVAKLIFAFRYIFRNVHVCWIYPCGWDSHIVLTINTHAKQSHDSRAYSHAYYGNARLKIYPWSLKLNPNRLSIWAYEFTFVNILQQRFGLTLINKYYCFKIRKTPSINIEFVVLNLDARPPCDFRIAS